MQKKVDAQILVVILLVLSILSIFVLSMVTNARKDTIEKIDNKKYEQFYSLAEKQLIETQSIIGIKTYTATELKAVKKEDNLTPVFNDCKDSTADFGKNGIECTIAGDDGEGVSYESSTTLDKATTTLYISDGPELHLYTLSSDSNLNVNLKNGTAVYTGDLKIYWDSPTSAIVNWIVTIDYYKTSASDQLPAYNSVKVSDIGVTNPDPKGQVVIGVSNEIFGGKAFQKNINLHIREILQDAGVPTPYDTTVIGMRIKPLIGTASGVVSLAIAPADPASFPTQFRKITAVVNSIANANGEKSPTPILNMEYPINLPINPLFDYVLRAGSLVQTD